MAISDQEFRKIAEAVAVLAGWRGDSSRAALLRGELSLLQNYISRLNTDAEQLDKKIGLVNTEVTEAKDDLELLSSGLSDVQSGLTGAQGILIQLQNDLDAAQEQIDAIAEGSSTAQQDINQLKAQASAVSTPAPSQADVTAPPTAADFNQAMTDMRAIASALTALKTAIS